MNKEMLVNKLLKNVREIRCSTVQDLIADCKSSVLNTELKRKNDGILVQEALKSKGFITVREIKLKYRSLYENGLVSYLETHFPNEVIECGVGGNKKKSKLIHPMTIEKAQEKFLQDKSEVKNVTK